MLAEWEYSPKQGLPNYSQGELIVLSYLTIPRKLISFYTVPAKLKDSRSSSTLQETSKQQAREKKGW